MGAHLEGRMEDPSQFKERRKYPRSLLDLPLEYRVMDAPHAHGGLVINVSETGLLIYSIKDIPTGLKLNIAILFPKGYELSHFELSAEVIWKDFHCREGLEGYIYGLRFIQMQGEERWKLKELLNSHVELDEISHNL